MKSGKLFFDSTTLKFSDSDFDCLSSNDTTTTLVHVKKGVQLALKYAAPATLTQQHSYCIRKSVKWEFLELYVLEWSRSNLFRLDEVRVKRMSRFFRFCGVGSWSPIAFGDSNVR